MRSNYCFLNYYNLELGSYIWQQLVGKILLTLFWILYKLRTKSTFSYNKNHEKGLLDWNARSWMMYRTLVCTRGPTPQVSFSSASRPLARTKEEALHFPKTPPRVRVGVHLYHSFRSRQGTCSRLSSGAASFSVTLWLWTPVACASKNPGRCPLLWQPRVRL